MKPVAYHNGAVPQWRITAADGRVFYVFGRYARTPDEATLPVLREPCGHWDRVRGRLVTDAAGPFVERRTAPGA